jgi:hypothetical protein
MHVEIVIVSSQTIENTRVILRPRPSESVELPVDSTDSMHSESGRRMAPVRHGVHVASRTQLIGMLMAPPIARAFAETIDLLRAPLIPIHSVMRTHVEDSVTRSLSHVAAVAMSAAVLVVLSAGSAGCGGAYYGITAAAASARLEEARQLGAETHAPYEYYYAKTHLEEAGFEASHASYSDAADYAEVAERYAIKALELSKAPTGSAGDARKSDAPAKRDPIKEEGESVESAGHGK